MDLTYAPVGSSIVSDDSSTKKKKAGFFKRGISSQESASQDGLAQPVEAKTGLFAPKPAKAHYSATRNLNKVLGLSLSYLVAIDLSQLPHLPPLILLSSTGPTETTGPLDPKLHFEGLRAPEKGILYQRSRALTLQYGHHSGLLVPVTEVADVGYLLCGFTDEPTRNFDDRDVRYFKRFATELEKWVVKTG
ncbi:hypothetical protein RQP46_006170 [Phenoliferia psychrophenolica]